MARRMIPGMGPAGAELPAHFFTHVRGLEG
jgi:hypothetical protein